MKGLPFHARPRKIGAQIDRMRGWPDFIVHRRIGNAVMWKGQLRGFQKLYTIGVVWGFSDQDRPYVFLIDPLLRPREGGTYEEIPHLMFDYEDPLSSGLCLFDPEGSEWSDCMLIADTTIPWTARWLYYYELWHYDGIWRGGGVGAESVAEARKKAVYAAAKEYAANA